MIEPKWVSGDFIPQQLADVLVEENIAGLPESVDNMGSFPNSYLIVNSFQMFSHTLPAWRQYT
jgi:hypothetical protein